MGRKGNSGMNAGGAIEYATLEDAENAMGFGNGGAADQWIESLTPAEIKAIEKYGLGGIRVL